MARIEDRRVVIFALDGLRASVFNQYVFQRRGGGPADSFLRRLAKKPEDRGFAYVSVDRAKTIFPSYTFPAWAAAFTGNYPYRNGIVGNEAFYRDLDAERKYDEFSGGDALYLYGWDWNFSRFAEITCEIALDIVNPLLIPDLFRILLDGFDDSRIWILKPPCWLLHPGLFKPLWPHRENFLNFFDSGGIQNGDLQTPTLYDYAAQHELSTYVVHQFYNRTLYQADSWGDVFDGWIGNINKGWGRPSYQDIRDWKLPDPDDNRLFDRRAFSMAQQYVQSKKLPSILTVYAAAIDLNTHKFRTYGHNSLEDSQFSGLAAIDREITRLVDEIQSADSQSYQNTLFFLIADHGHTENDKLRKIEKDTIQFPGESEPDQLFRIRPNGYMAHLYIKNGEWFNIPTTEQIEAFMTDVLPFATYQEGGRSLIEDIAFFVTRGRLVHRNFNGTQWEVFPLSALDDREYGFVDGSRRIEALLHRYRAGDVIMFPKRSSLPGKNTGFSGSDSTHGSLWPEDTLIPFYVWGEPLNEALGENGPIRLKEGNIVDLAPTVMSYLGFYDSHADAMEGKPLFDEDLHINLEDFEILEEKGALAWEILFGRMVLNEVRGG